MVFASNLLSIWFDRITTRCAAPPPAFQETKYCLRCRVVSGLDPGCCGAGALHSFLLLPRYRRVRVYQTPPNLTLRPVPTPRTLLNAMAPGLQHVQGKPRVFSGPCYCKA